MVAGLKLRTNGERFDDDGIDACLVGDPADGDDPSECEVWREAVSLPCLSGEVSEHELLIFIGLFDGQNRDDEGKSQSTIVRFILGGQRFELSRVVRDDVVRDFYAPEDWLAVSDLFWGDDRRRFLEGRIVGETLVVPSLKWN